MARDDYWMDETIEIKTGLSGSMRSATRSSGQVRYINPPLAEPAVHHAPAASTVPLFSQPVNRELTESELDEKALYDPVSQTFNFRFLVRLLQHEIVRARMFSRPFSIIVLSIDEFVSLAINYGPTALDHIVATVGGVIKENFRVVDHIGRYTESRFIAVCPEADLEQAAVLAEQLSSRIQQTSVSHQWQQINISASIGIATFSELTSDVESMIAMADLGADLACEQGGNAACFAPDLVA